MSLNRFRLYFMLPTTTFVGLFEYLRHYPLRHFINSLVPGAAGNIISVIILMLGVALFSEGFVYNIQKLNGFVLQNNKVENILNQISTDLSLLLAMRENFKALDYNEILVNILQKISLIVGWDFAGWFLVDNNLDVLYWKAMYGNKDDNYKKYRKHISKELISQIFPKDQVFKIINFPDEAPGVADNYPTLVQEGIKSVIAIPMYYNDIPLGMMVIGSRITKSVTDNEINILMNLAQRIAIIFKNIMLQEELQYHATMEERCRLAREIHDRLAQDISYLNLKLKGFHKLLINNAVEDENISAELNHLKEVAAGLFTEARNSIYDLNTVTYENNNLTTILSLYLDQFGRRYELGWQLKVPECLPNLQSGIELHLIRIVQEALANVRKHAKATKVIVEIMEINNILIVNVIDNGIGFNLNDKKLNSFGIGIMEERAKIIGGQVKIESNPSNGSKVSIRIPIMI